MADIQKQFEQFHEDIKLKRFGENAILRAKRDIIRNRLEEKLPEIFAQYDEECPEYSFRDQGSYEMGTGIKPLNGDYDIDQGLYFEVSTDTYPDPVVLKKRVYGALEGHTYSVQIRRPCITVFYQCNDEPLYHVDIAVYSGASENSDGKSRLAMGKEYSTDECRFWEVSDPQLLTDMIFARFSSGNPRDQFRRIVRYLKRWKDVNFSIDGNEAPLGIGLTVVTYDLHQTRYMDSTTYKPDDLCALHDLTNAILLRFVPVWDSDKNEWIDRLAVRLPIEPWHDLFVRMSSKQMSNFKEKLETLRDALQAAITEVDPVEACEILTSVFGEDFPVPSREETSKRHAPAIISSSSSA